MSTSIYEALAELYRNAGEGVLVTVIEKEGSGPLPPGAKMLVYPDGRSVGTVGGGALERMALEKAAQMFGTTGSAVQRYAMIDRERVAPEEESTGMVCGGKATLFFEVLSARSRLYLFGGGHVGQALARHLRDLPYHVTVIDHRPGIEAQVRDADRVIIEEYDSALTGEAIPEGSFFIIATPDHDADYRVLRMICRAGWKPGYVGLLASRKKAARFVHDLKEELGPDLDLSALYTPAGLDIGGSTADEIALSVVAEVQAVKYGRITESVSTVAPLALTALR